MKKIWNYILSAFRSKPIVNGTYYARFQVCDTAHKGVKEYFKERGVNL